jgi:DsbC/DsbD-like thiol-disulfide interchange protein
MRGLFLPLACISVLCAWAQNRGHLEAGQPQKVTGKRGDVVQAKIPVSIDEGFHVNSNKPTEEFLIPLRLTWTSTGALEPGVVMFPKPSTETVAGQKLSVFTGKFDLVANFKIAANAEAGPGSAAGKLSYQACNSTTCFPPKTIDVSVPYQVQ